MFKRLTLAAVLAALPAVAAAVRFSGRYTHRPAASHDPRNREQRRDRAHPSPGPQTARAPKRSLPACSTRRLI